MKKNMKKIIVVALAVAMLALTAVAGTLAWLHDNAAESFKVTTYGDVSIAMAVTDYTDNEMYLIPNGLYNFDPTVTIGTVTAPAVSEDFFLRMFVTVTKAAELKQLMTDGVVEKMDGADIMDIEDYLDDAAALGAGWALYKSAEVDGKFVYEFRYTGAGEKGCVVGSGETITKLFSNFRLDKRLNDDDVKALQGLEITFEAQAMQAVEEQVFGTAATKNYFENAQAAWTEFDKQIGATYNNPVQELITSTQNGNVPYTPGVTLP